MTEYICIVCPSSCRLQVEESAGTIKVSGNECKRGIAHAESEHKNPMRMLTTTVAICGGTLPRLPVISADEIPKSKLKECLNLLYCISLAAPIKCGEIVCRDICGTGVDVVASRSMISKQE